MENKHFEIKECEFCKTEMKLKIVQKGPRKGQLDKKVLGKRFCSKECQDKWQRGISWEDRIGKDRASEIRSERSIQVSGENNPSKNPLVAKKISESMKKHLESNPRYGEKNGFYGKEHSDEYKIWASESRSGKRSYDDEQHIKQKKNTPKKDNHPNWQGGLSYGEYDLGFDNEKRQIVKERDNYECQLCGCDDGLLHIHHIDYDKQNSDERNLITLCNSCHSKTNWKRESWIRFFEPIMLEKYK